jgi:AraC-like DNA-binding protein
METLLQADVADPVGQLLGLLRVRSTVYCRSVMRAPWGFRVPARPVAGFHLVTQGSAWLEVEGENGMTPLSAGDLAILPRGSGHTVRSDAKAPVRLLDDILAEYPVDKGKLVYSAALPLRSDALKHPLPDPPPSRGREHVSAKGEGEPAGDVLLCGGFVLEERRLNPLLSRLPAVLKIEGQAGGPLPWLKRTIDLLTGEMTAAYAGVQTLVTRLSEVLLVQALRGYFSELNGNTPPGLAGFADPQIGKAIAMMQERPAEPWTLDRMASAVAMSRAAFAARFRELTGDPPMRYLTRYRVFAAALELRQSNDSLARIAESTGYESEVSLSKAFRRYFGVAPGIYRKATAVES